MTRRLLPILILMLVLTSCMHQSPFRSEYYFQAMGREGDIVITVNDSSLLSGFLPDEIIGRAVRISAVVNADGGIYGGAEGDFGYTGINALLDWAPEFRKVDGDPFYFQARSSSFEAAVPESGLLLFSSVSYPEAYALTVSDRSLVIDDRTAAEMASHDAAVYMNHPARVAMPARAGWHLPRRRRSSQPFAVSRLDLDDAMVPANLGRDLNRK